MPPKLYGRHSLESYGHRLGEYKGNFGQTADWSAWSKEMEDYCEQDVIVTNKTMPTFPPLPDWVQLEHQVAHILQKQEEHGWYFDERAAYELESALRGELEEATEILRRKYGSLLEQCLHLSEITGHKGTYKDAHLQNLNNLTPPHETT